MSKPTGGNAFPTNLTAIDGMTLRDWFAGQALSGVDMSGWNSYEAAKWAYGFADAMLAERAKE